MVKEKASELWKPLQAELPCSLMGRGCTGLSIDMPEGMGTDCTEAPEALLEVWARGSKSYFAMWNWLDRMSDLQRRPEQTRPQLQRRNMVVEM